MMQAVTTMIHEDVIARSGQYTKTSFSLPEQIKAKFKDSLEVSKSLTVLGVQTLIAVKCSL